LTKTSYFKLGKIQTYKKHIEGKAHVALKYIPTSVENYGKAVYGNIEEIVICSNFLKAINLGLDSKNLRRILDTVSYYVHLREFKIYYNHFIIQLCRSVAE